MASRKDSNKLEEFAILTSIIGNVSVFVGIAFSVFGVYYTITDVQVALRALKMAGVDQIGKIVEEDSEVRVDLANFLADVNSDSIMCLVDSYGTGMMAYSSSELTVLRTAGRHYERVGALVNLGYIEFDLVYEIIPFPDDFWEITEKFRSVVRTKNWSKRGGLPDFWKNFERLHDRYTLRRLEDAQEANDGQGA